MFWSLTTNPMINISNRHLELCGNIAHNDAIVQHTYVI